MGNKKKRTQISGVKFQVINLIASASTMGYRLVANRNHL
jgi:hypothetical protein